MDIFRKIASSDERPGLLLVAFAGNFSTIILAIILVYTFLKSVWKEQSVGDRRVYENILLFFSSDMWVLYSSLSQPYKPLFVGASGVGFVLQIICIFIYIYFVEGKKFTQAFFLFSISIVVAMIITALVAWAAVTHSWSNTFIAVIASGSGLSIHIVTFFDLVKKRTEAKNMNPITLGISLFCAFTWTAYGFMSIPVNPYIVVPNLLGIASAAVQLILYTMHKFKTIPEEVAEIEPEEMTEIKIEHEAEVKNEETAETEPEEMAEIKIEHKAEVKNEETNNRRISTSDVGSDLSINSSIFGSDLGRSSCDSSSILGISSSDLEAPHDIGPNITFQLDVVIHPAF